MDYIFEGGKILNKITISIGISFLFIVSSITPIVIGYNISTYETGIKTEDYNSDFYLYPECIAREKFPEHFYQKDNKFNFKNEAEICSKNRDLNLLKKIKSFTS